MQTVSGMDHIYIYLHEVEGEDIDGQGEKHHYYEYDFKEIIVPSGEIDTDAVKENPEDWLEYEPVAPVTVEDLQMALSALQDIVLGG